jgi:multidrug efflux pump subunit AcrA (membrane-fusion protein)
MKLKLAAVALLCAVGVGALVYSFGGFGASAAQGPEYLTATAAFGDVTAEIAATGTLAATSRTAVAFGLDAWIVNDGVSSPASPAPFRVTEVTASVGSTVKAGDALAAAESPDLERQLTAATYDQQSAQLSLSNAEDALEEAQLAAATLTAPIDGVITEINIATGFDAPAGAAIVIDAPGLQVTTDVVESDLASVEVGQTATVSIDAVGAEATGTVTAISPLANEGGSVVSYPVTVVLDETPEDAHAGMSADVTITTATAEGVLTVPTAALQGTEGNYRVRTLAGDGTVTAVPVEIGLTTASLAEITSGLSAGTTVVTGTASDLAGRSTTGTGGFVVPGGGGFAPNGGGFAPNGGGGGGNGGVQP